jgi:tetratricopeptide (TPR) repeat protein
MATLEVHDGRGRSFQVEIDRARPTLIGADPSCDVVVNDPRARPFHARIRVSSDGGLKVEAFPDARSVDLNGRKVAAGRVRQGDEVQIGAYRIFLLAESQGAVPTPARRLAPPQAAIVEDEADEGLDWLDDRGDDALPPPPSAPARRRSAASALPGEEEAVALAPRATRTPWWRRLLRSLNAGGAPGEDRLGRSPLVLALLLILGMLTLIGLGLWTVVNRNRANRQYALATAAFDERDYKGAVAAYDEFLRDHPSDIRRSRARVNRELANVRQFSASNAAAWNSAIEAARRMYESTRDEAFYPDAKMDLAAEVLKAATGILQSTAKSADARSLVEANDALKLYDEIVGPPAKTLREKAKIPDLVQAAEAAVEKARVRREALAAMTEKVEGRDPDAAFQARDALVARYPDLADDRELATRLDAASELVRAAARFDESGRPGETEPHPDPLGPPVSLVSRLVPQGSTAPPATPDAPLAFALAQGHLYAVDGSNGAPIWHQPIGLTSPFAPIPVAGQPASILVLDARYDELVRLDARTGKLLWRQSLGETVTAPPLVLGNQVIQATPSGRLLFLSLNDGALRGSLEFGRGLAATPAADETGQYLYVAADRDCVFVVQREPVECVGVAYLGHKPGSVKAAPARLADYLIVPQNDDLWQGRWAVFQLDKDGEALRLLQTVVIPGWTWQTPVSQGSYLWSLTDRNAITAFGLAPEGSREPLRQVATTVADARPTGPGFARARSDREIWISGSRLGRFDLDAERGSMTANWTIERAGPALAPIQMAGRLAVFTHQFEEGPGVALWGVDPATGKVAWKTVLGAPWPLEPSPAADGATLTTLAMDGPQVTITPDLLTRGGFVEMPLRRPGYFNLPAGPLRRLERDGLTVLVPSPEADHLLVREGTDGEFRRIDLPAPLGAAPLFWGSDLLVPGLDGRAYLVDPRTGAPRAEPYVPTFDAAAPTRWLDPVPLGDDAVLLADQSGTLRRLARQTEPRVKLAAIGEPEDLKAALDAPPVATRESVIVSTADGRIRSLSDRDLSALGAWNLEVPRAYGPVALDEGSAAVFDRSGGVLFFSPEGNRAWTTELGDEPPFGPPLLRKESLWILGRDGVLHRRSAADGSPLDRLVLNVHPAGGLSRAGSDLVVAAAPGTVRRVLPEVAPENTP